MMGQASWFTVGIAFSVEAKAPMTDTTLRRRRQRVRAMTAGEHGGRVVAGEPDFPGR
jgi:hypothetical protein